MLLPPLMLLFHSSTLSLTAGMLRLADIAVSFAGSVVFLPALSVRMATLALENSLGASEVIPDVAEKMAVVALSNASLDSTGFEIDGKC